MIDLKFGIFIVPVIALTVILSLYAFFLRRTADKSAFRQFVGRGVVLAFLLNYGWELSHCPLYKGFVYDRPHVALLALASLADTIMVGLLYFGFAVIYRNGLWIKQLTASRVFWLLLAGGAGAIESEIAHLSAGNWAYTDRMPLVFGVGLTPVLQFSILPLLIYFLSFHRSANKPARLSSVSPSGLH